ncbi:hypothetical protein SUDANB13_01069 [Streptomyces sp. enrichment culture]
MAPGTRQGPYRDTPSGSVTAESIPQRFDMPVTGHFGQRSQESDPRTGPHRATLPSVSAQRHVPTTAGWLRPNQCPTWLEQAENESNPRPLVTGNEGQPSGPPRGRPFIDHRTNGFEPFFRYTALHKSRSRRRRPATRRSRRAVAHTAMRCLGIAHITLSPWAVREGVLLNSGSTFTRCHREGPPSRPFGRRNAGSPFRHSSSRDVRTADSRRRRSCLQAPVPSGSVTTSTSGTAPRTAGRQRAGQGNRARAVNKERARSGEAKSASRSSTGGKSPSQRGGEKSGSSRSGGSGGGPTREQL